MTTVAVGMSEQLPFNNKQIHKDITLIHHDIKVTGTQPSSPSLDAKTAKKRKWIAFAMLLSGHLLPYVFGFVVDHFLNLVEWELFYFIWYWMLVSAAIICFASAYFWPTSIGKRALLSILTLASFGLNLAISFFVALASGKLPIS